MNYSKGICWIDDCRIPFTNDDNKIDFDRPRTRKSVNEDWVLKQAHDYTNPDYKEYNNQGRFPANLLCSDDVLNDGSVSKSEGGKGKINEASFTYEKWNKYFSINDKGTNSRYYDIDKWFDQLLNKQI